MNDKSTTTTTRPAEPSLLEVETLIREIESYLSVVQAFRRAGCEPNWRS